MDIKKPALSNDPRAVILADGGALSDFNERLKSEDPPKRKDFVKIPDEIIAALREDYANLECSLESRVFCNVGSQNAQGFNAKMAATWNVRTFAVSFARYERSGEIVADRHASRIRFHAYIAYALGVIVGAQAGSAETVVAVVSDDPQLIPCISDARSRGLDVRMVWWESGIAEEVQYLATRNNVEPLLLSNHDEARRQAIAGTPGSIHCSRPETVREAAFGLLRSTKEGLQAAPSTRGWFAG